MVCEASSDARSCAAEAEFHRQQSGATSSQPCTRSASCGGIEWKKTREAALGGLPDVSTAADLMLAALHDANGASSDTVIEIMRRTVVRQRPSRHVRVLSGRAGSSYSAASM